MTPQAIAEREGMVLLGWLRLLGWSVVMERDGGRWIGLAQRPDTGGTDLRVSGSAASRRELVSLLFSRAIQGQELLAA
jgi:hypothetical protein